MAILNQGEKVSYTVVAKNAAGDLAPLAAGSTVTVTSGDVASATIVADATPADGTVASGFVVAGAKGAVGLLISAQEVKADGTPGVAVGSGAIDVVVAEATVLEVGFGTPQPQ